MATKTAQQLESVDNIGIFHGLRVLLCFGVVLIHMFVYAYTMALPSDIMMKNDNSPHLLPWSSLSSAATSIISPLFSWLFHGVDVFFFISGFLCCYQLYYIDNKKENLFYFLLNRLIRLYPIYLLHVIRTLYILFGIEGCNKLTDVLKSIFFIDNFWYSTTETSCSGAVAWSLSLDMHTFILLIIIFYLFDIKSNKSIIYKILWSIFGLSWIISIYVFHKHTLPHIRVDDDGNLIPLGQGIEIYEPDTLRSMMHDIDPYKYINKRIYDPDNATNEQLRMRSLHNAYYTLLYMPTHTHIGCGLFGAITCLQLLSPSSSSSSQRSVFVYWIFNIFFTVTASMVNLSSYGYVKYLYFDTNSIFTSILLGSFWKLASLSVFCGMNIWLRVNNKYFNLVLNNRITHFLSKFSYPIYMFHSWAIIPFVWNDEWRGCVASDDHTKCNFIDLFSKVILSVFAISITSHYVVEYPFIWFRKKYISSKYYATTQKIKEN